jgi:hypothetical protein
VPWSQSNINYNIVNKMQGFAYSAFRTWQKYSALNLIPVISQGTIEFRHLHGTRDVTLIKNWICSIAKIFEYALNNSFEDARAQITNMNTVSNYRQWLNAVFGDYADNLAIYDGFERDLAIGVIESKLMLTKELAYGHPEDSQDEEDPEPPDWGNAEMILDEARNFNLTPPPVPTFNTQAHREVLANAPDFTWDAALARHRATIEDDVIPAAAPIAVEPWPLPRDHFVATRLRETVDRINSRRVRITTPAATTRRPF